MAAARREPLSAVHHPVTGPEQGNAGALSLGQLVQHPGNDVPVGTSGKPLFGWSGRKPLDPKQRIRPAKSLADTLHEALSAFGEQQRELDRRAARVEYEHLAGRTASRALLRTRSRHGRWRDAHPKPRLPVTGHLGGEVITQPPR
jgi:hypothetical protein